MLNAGDNIICTLTGLHVTENFQEPTFTGHHHNGPFSDSETDDHANYIFQNAISSLQLDLIVYFSRVAGLDEIREAIFQKPQVGEENVYPDISQDGTPLQFRSLVGPTVPVLSSTIRDIIARTFSLCSHLLSDPDHGYRVICSIYIHIIISIYSSKTVYDALLFKSTKNKKLDGVLKRVREEWMRILTTGDTSLRDTQ